MKNILVPTDFSPTSKNAAIYALNLAKQIAAAKVILYHAFQPPLIVDTMVPAVQVWDEVQLKKDSNEALQHFRNELLSDCSENCLIETYCEYALLNDGLDDIVSKTDSGLIVMGITGGGIISEKLVGSNTVSVARHTNVPVIIVPPKLLFTTINRVMLLSDFDKADESIPVNAIRLLLHETKAKLLVYHFNDHPDQTGLMYPSNVMGESYAVHTLLEDLHPEYHFAKGNGFTTSINQFAEEHAVDLIITIPKHHGLLDSLFTTSHTTKLAFHSHLPLMVIHK